MVDMVLPTVSVPIRTDKDGNIRVANTRVTLDTVIACYQQGDTPERIREGFPRLQLVDIYTVIAYYLSHREEVEAYLRKQAEEAEEIRRKIEAERPDIFALEAILRERIAKRDK